ncbi:Protein cbp3, mitochondrial [Onygenales sp. PD_12]|nr:Protein cbp3, mitochondrial [Onygenales sp. PD_12]KAK2803871.1 Protein cbp3, mitochondrial [Onygenales sp. PD_10]
MSSKITGTQCSELLRLALKPQTSKGAYYTLSPSHNPFIAAPAASRTARRAAHLRPSCRRYTSTSSPQNNKSRNIPPPKAPQSTSTSPINNIAQTLQSRASRTTETYIAYGATKKLFEACQLPADYTVPQASEAGAEVPKTANGEDLGVAEGTWYKELGLLPTFSTWSQITFLHMYLITVRLRTLPSQESFRTYSRHLLDNFSHNAEHRMTVLHGISMRGVRNRYLKDLFIQWRGVLAAYDQGLVSGDAVLGAAVWRNIWKAEHTDPNGGEIDWEKVALVVAYMRRVMAELGRIDEFDLVTAVGGLQRDGTTAKSLFRFTEQDRRLVGLKSRGVVEPVVGEK